MPNAIRMPTEAEELCMIPVKIIPTKRPSSGFDKAETVLMKTWESLRKSKFSLMISIPMNRIPKPAAI